MRTRMLSGRVADPGRGGSRALPPRLLVAPPDPHHPAPNRRLVILGLLRFLGLANLLGDDLVGQPGLSAILAARLAQLAYGIREFVLADPRHVRLLRCYWELMAPSIPPQRWRSHWPRALAHPGAGATACPSR